MTGAAEHAHAFLETWAPHQAADERELRATIDTVPDHAYVRWTLRVSGRAFAFVSHYAFRDGLIVDAQMFPFDAAGLAHWHAALEEAAAHPGPR